MSVGFYIDSLKETDQNKEIYNTLNDAVTGGEVKDASVFYNDVEFNPILPKFGVFNSTDIWMFTGKLICTTLDNVRYAKRIVNKFKLYYLYNRDENDLIKLLDISGVDIITENEEDTKELYRLTGKKPVLQDKISHFIGQI